MDTASATSTTCTVIITIYTSSAELSIQLAAVTPTIMVEHVTLTANNIFIDNGIFATVTAIKPTTKYAETGSF